jgi:hypothetical protein
VPERPDSDVRESGPGEVTERAHALRSPEPQFAGLRLTADEFFDLSDDGHRYELVQGVVVMSPS